MNDTEYKSHVLRGARAMAEIVSRTDIKTYGHFFQVWYNYLWHVFEARQAGEKEPLLMGGDEMKDVWDSFIEAWDAGCDAANEDEKYYEFFIVDVFNQLSLQNAPTVNPICKCKSWDKDPEKAEIYNLYRTYELVDLSHDHRSIFECHECGQAYLWSWHESSWLTGEEVTMNSCSISPEQRKYFVSLSTDKKLGEQEKDQLIVKKLTKDLSKDA